ncbi:hypothetical protein CKAN_00161200 [Cinnamomum micranthum f. kanehirae]|uniref:Uncharacterized protein n=1 Tax=Cinnamomum micranthum f. kanehirae TaxID=337451 RepID=A0A3S3MGI7_9MAGN|nr:hypothetical protein CKAN_00161200 [Cinnamomum micranthum f. kanehirae]
MRAEYSKRTSLDIFKCENKSSELITACLLLLLSSFDAGSCNTSDELVYSDAAAIGNRYIDLNPDPQKDIFTESSALMSNVGRVVYKTPMIA